MSGSSIYMMEEVMMNMSEEEQKEMYEEVKRDKMRELNNEYADGCFEEWKRTLESDEIISMFDLEDQLTEYYKEVIQND